MGPYCQFCDQRCFVPRTVPGRPHVTILATCAKGMEHDRKMTGFDHATAINPRDPEALRCGADGCDALLAPLPRNRMFPDGPTVEWVDSLNNKASSTPTFHEHRPAEVLEGMSTSGSDA